MISLARFLAEMKLQFKMLIWGGLVFSTLNSAIFTFKGFNFGDIFCLILIGAYWKDPTIRFIRKNVMTSRLFIIFCLVILFYFVIGCINHGDIVSALRDARSLVYFAVGFVFSYKKKWANIDKLYYLVLWSFIADILMNIYFPRDPDISSFKNYYYLSGIPLIIAVPWVYKKTLLTFFGLFLVVVLSVSSGYRTVSLISVATIVMAWIVISYVGLKSNHKIKAIFLLAVGAVLISLIYINMATLFEVISSYILSINQKLFNMLIYKSNLLLAGESESDKLRLAYITHIFKYWYRYIIPYGLGYSTTIDNIRSFKDEFNFGGNTVDNTYFWMVYHYGIIMAFTLFACFVTMVTKLFALKNKSKMHLVMIIIIVPFMISNLTFSFLSIPFHAFFTAIILGILFRLASDTNTSNKTKLLCNQP